MSSSKLREKGEGIEEKLEIVKKFQKRFPGSHVGGSIGLFLHGIDLKRDFKKSDIDLTIPAMITEPVDIETVDESSNPEDFDYQFRHYENANSSVYTKVDISVKYGKEFDIIVYNDHQYQVSKLADIYFYKSKYAVKGVEKHIDDFITIATGTRPERTKKEDEQPVPVTNEIDDLPF